MKKEENANVTRRSFLTKGAAAASIIAIPGLVASKAHGEVTIPETMSNMMPSNDPVYTESVQTLSNKTIPSRANIVGTDTVNVREFPITAPPSPNPNNFSGDISTALNSAISYLVNSGGGRLLIPHGIWSTNGGHDFTSGVSIEGVGTDTIYTDCTQIWLNSGEGTYNYIFRIKTPNVNCSLKRLTLNMQDKANSIGLLMTDYDANGEFTDKYLYFTNLEEVQFLSGSYGIKVDSKENSGISTNFECIMNRFERLSFYGCNVGFYCNSVNGGYLLDSCYFNIPTGLSLGASALYCKWIGYLEVSNCLFTGNQALFDDDHPLADDSTILKTFGGFGSIYFHNCQDERVQYFYRNDVNAWAYVPIVVKNSLIQSSFKFTGSGALILDSCQINVGKDSSGRSIHVKDSSTAAVRLYYKGLNNFFYGGGTPGILEDFVNTYSQVLYESNEIGKVAVNPPTIPSTSPPAYSLNVTRGIVKITAGSYWVQVYSYLVTADTLILAQLRTFDSGGARIREVQCFAGYFQINLTQAAATDLTVGYKIELD